MFVCCKDRSPSVIAQICKYSINNCAMQFKHVLVVFVLAAINLPSLTHSTVCLVLS